MTALEDFTNPFARFLTKETNEQFDIVGGRYGWSIEGAIEALLTEDLFRESVADDFLGRTDYSCYPGLLLAWHLSGRNTFCVSAPLADALDQTHLEQVPTTALRFPFPTIVVLYPPDAGPQFPVPFEDFRLLGMLATDSLKLDLAWYQAAFAPRAPMELRRRILNEITEEMVRDHHRISMVVVGRAPGPKHYIFHHAMEFPEPELAACVERVTNEAQSWRRDQLPHVAQRMRRRIPLAALATGADDAMSALQTRGDREHPALRRVTTEALLKVCLYLNSQGADATSVPFQHRGKTSPKARAIFERHRRLHGHPVILGASFGRVAPTGDDAGEPRSSPRPHLVRGHFKQQPFGPGAAERRLLWIAPYWRCDDGDGQRVEREYLLRL